MGRAQLSQTCSASSSVLMKNTLCSLVQSTTFSAVVVVSVDHNSHVVCPPLPSVSPFHLERIQIPTLPSVSVAILLVTIKLILILHLVSDQTAVEWHAFLLVMTLRRSQVTLSSDAIELVVEHLLIQREPILDAWTSHVPLWAIVVISLIHSIQKLTTKLTRKLSRLNATLISAVSSAAAL